MKNLLFALTAFLLLVICLVQRQEINAMRDQARVLAGQEQDIASLQRAIPTTKQYTPQDKQLGKEMEAEQ